MRANVVDGGGLLEERCSEGPISHKGQEPGMEFCGLGKLLWFQNQRPYKVLVALSAQHPERLAHLRC